MAVVIAADQGGGRRGREGRVEQMSRRKRRENRGLPSEDSGVAEMEVQVDDWARAQDFIGEDVT